MNRHHRLELALGTLCWSASGLAAPLPARPGVIVFKRRQRVRRRHGAARRRAGPPARLPAAPVFRSVEWFQRKVAPLRDPAAPFNPIAFHGGDNDIGAGQGAAEAYASLARYVAMAHAQHWRVVLSTELPRPEWPPEQQARLAASIALQLRNEAGADAVVPYDGAPEMQAPAGRAASPRFSPDGVHPNAAGYAVLARIIAAAIERLLPAAPG